MNRETITSALSLHETFDPTGMSDGGLFKCGSFVRGADGQNCLLGVLIENHTTQRGSILATRLSLVTEAIRAAFPDVAAYIPRSRRLRVKVRFDGT